MMSDFTTGLCLHKPELPGNIFRVMKAKQYRYFAIQCLLLMPNSLFQYHSVPSFRQLRLFVGRKCETLRRKVCHR